jgi:hypothetical protein
MGFVLCQLQGILKDNAEHDVSEIWCVSFLKGVGGDKYSVEFFTKSHFP